MNVVVCTPESRRMWVTRGGVVVVCIMYVCVHVCIHKLPSEGSTVHVMYVHMCGSLVYCTRFFNFNTNT